MDPSPNAGKLCRWLAAVTLVLIATGPISQTAYAAESAAFNWSGAYIGLHMGYGWGDADTSISPLPTAASFVNLAPQTQSPDPKGFLGGPQIGYNWQRGIFVVGGETDLSFSDMKGTTIVSPIIQNDGTPYLGGNITVHQDTDWVGTLRLRAGVTVVPKVLLFSTVGMAYGHVNYSANTDFRPTGTNQYPTSFTKLKVGWTAGMGAEFAINRNWSVKTEYLYYDLGSESITAASLPFNPIYAIGYKWDTAAHTARIGLNFRF